MDYSSGQDSCLDSWTSWPGCSVGPPFGGCSLFPISPIGNEAGYSEVTLAPVSFGSLSLGALRSVPSSLSMWVPSCSVMSNSLWPHGLWPVRLLCPWDCSGKILEGVANPPSGDLPNQGPNPHLLHWHMDSLPLPNYGIQLCCLWEVRLMVTGGGGSTSSGITQIWIWTLYERPQAI